MSALEADDELRGPVPDDRVYDLVLAATGSEERASAAFQARVAYRNSRNERTQT